MKTIGFTMIMISLFLMNANAQTCSHKVLAQKTSQITNKISIDTYALTASSDAEYMRVTIMKKAEELTALLRQMETELDSYAYAMTGNINIKISRIRKGGFYFMNEYFRDMPEEVASLEIEQSAKNTKGTFRFLGDTYTELPEEELMLPESNTFRFLGDQYPKNPEENYKPTL